MEEFPLEIPITFETTVEEKSTISSAMHLSFVSIVLIGRFAFVVLVLAVSSFST